MHKIEYVNNEKHIFSEDFMVWNITKDDIRVFL